MYKCTAIDYLIPRGGCRRGDVPPPRTSDLDSFIKLLIIIADGRPAHAAYCSKLDEGTLVTRLEDRYSYQYQQIKLKPLNIEQELSFLLCFGPR